MVSKVKEDFLGETTKVVELEEQNLPMTVLAMSGRAVNEYKTMEVIMYSKKKPFHFLIVFDKPATY